MSSRIEHQLNTGVFAPKVGRSGVVVAGPSSSLTVPGVVVAEITHALAKITRVTRIEVDAGANVGAGIHRAPSLSAAHDSLDADEVVRHALTNGSRPRAQSFLNLMPAGTATVVAYAWPGNDNNWIQQFIHAGRSAGALTVVACASLPQPSHARAVSLAGICAYADAVLVGDDTQAKEMIGVYGRAGPFVESHPALSLDGRSGRPSKQQITAFVSKDDVASLSTLLAAFDAIPEAWVDAYRLQVLMRFSDRVAPELVESSYHHRHVELINDNMSSLDLQDLCTGSSAIGIATPDFDSRAFSVAVDCGVGTVVLRNGKLPDVGRGYVGGLLANRERTASVNVALFHALRLAELQFPNPSKWNDLAQRIVGSGQRQAMELKPTAGV